MNIIFVRHGESKFNADLTKGDAFEDTDLTERGKKQARALGEKLKDYGISEIYTSDLKRTKQTGEIVSKIIKVPIKENLSELNEYRSSYLRARIRLDREHNKSLRKLRKFLEKISEERDEDKTILIVAHGNTNRLIMASLMKLPISRKLFRFSQHNTCINLLLWIKQHGNWSLRSFNNISHLPAKLKDKIEK